MRLKGKVAIITGSSSGIGFEIAKAYLDEGAKVVICGISEDDANIAIDKLKDNYLEENYLGVAVDITKDEEVTNLFEKTIKKFGKIDILVNNAGIAPHKSIEEVSSSEFMKTIDINLVGAFRCSKEAVKYLKENGGSIINTSSFVSLYGSNNQSAYTASKSGLNGLTKALAKELGKYSIRVNAVAPGVIMTDMVKKDVDDKLINGLKMMTPLQRTADPKDLVGIYVYLASDESPHTTGTIINIDGGLVM